MRLVANRNHDDVGARFLDEPVNHRIEKTHIPHHGVVNDGENEQNCRGPGLTNTSLDEFKDLCRREPADQCGNDRYNNKQRHRVRFGTNQCRATMMTIIAKPTTPKNMIQPP